MYSLWYAYFMYKNSNVKLGDIPFLRKPADKVASTGTTSSISAPPKAVQPPPSAPVRTPSTPKDIPGRSPPVQAPVPPPAKKAPPPVQPPNRFLPGHGHSISSHLNSCIGTIIRRNTVEQQAAIEAFVRTAGLLESESEKQALEERVRADLANKDRELAAALDQCLKEAGKEAEELAVKHAREAFEKVTKKFNDEMAAASAKVAAEKAAALAVSTLSSRIREVAEKTAMDEFLALEECVKSAGTYLSSENQAAALEKCLQGAAARKAAADASAMSNLLEDARKTIAAEEENARNALLQDLLEKERAEAVAIEQCVKEATAKKVAEETAKVEQLYKQKAEETLALADAEVDICVKNVSNVSSTEVRDSLEACIKLAAKKKADTDAATMEALITDAARKIQDEEMATIYLCTQRAMKKIKGEDNGGTHEQDGGKGGIGTTSGTAGERNKAEPKPGDDYGKSKAEMFPGMDGSRAGKRPTSVGEDSKSKSGLAPGESKSPLVPGRDGSSSRSPLVPGSYESSIRSPLVPGSDGSSSRSPLIPGKDGSSSRSPLFPGREGSSGKSPLVSGKDGSSSRSPLIPGKDGSSIRSPLIPGRDGSSGKSPLVSGKDGSSSRSPLFPGREGSSGKSPLVPGKDGTRSKSPLVPGKKDSIHKLGLSPGVGDSSVKSGLGTGTDDSKSKSHVVPGKDGSRSKSGFSVGVASVKGEAGLAKAKPELPTSMGGATSVSCGPSPLPSAPDDGSRGKASLTIKEDKDSVGLSTGPDDRSKYGSTSGDGTAKIKSESIKRESGSIYKVDESTENAVSRTRDGYDGAPRTSGQYDECDEELKALVATLGVGKSVKSQTASKSDNKGGGSLRPGLWRDGECVCESSETLARRDDRKFGSPLSIKKEPGIDEPQAGPVAKYNRNSVVSREKAQSPTRTWHASKPTRVTVPKDNDSGSIAPGRDDVCKPSPRDSGGTKRSSPCTKYAGEKVSDASYVGKNSLKGTYVEPTMSYGLQDSREKNFGKVPVTKEMCSEEVQTSEAKPSVANEEVQTRGKTRSMEVQTKMDVRSDQVFPLPDYSSPQNTSDEEKEVCVPTEHSHPGPSKAKTTDLIQQAEPSEEMGTTSYDSKPSQPVLEECDDESELPPEKAAICEAVVRAAKLRKLQKNSRSQAEREKLEKEAAELEMLVAELAAAPHEPHEKPDVGVLKKMDKASELRAAAKAASSQSERTRLAKEAADIERLVAESVAICEAKNEAARLREATSCAATREEKECLERAAAEREALAKKLEHCVSVRKESEARRAMNEVVALREAARVTNSETERARFEKEASEREKLIPENTAVRKAQIEAARLREAAKWAQCPEERICLERAAEERETFVNTICATSGPPSKTASGRDIRERPSGMMRQGTRRPTSRKDSFGPKRNSKPSSASSFVDSFRKEHLPKRSDQKLFSTAYEALAGQLGSEENFRKKRPIDIPTNRLSRMGSALSNTCQMTDISFLIPRKGSDADKRPQSQPQTMKRSDSQKALANTMSEDLSPEKAMSMTVATFRQKEKADIKLESGIQDTTEANSKENEVDSDRLASYSSARSFLSRISDGKSESDHPETKSESQKEALKIDPTLVKTESAWRNVSLSQKSGEVRGPDRARLQTTSLGSDVCKKKPAERSPQRDQEGAFQDSGQKFLQNEAESRSSARDNGMYEDNQKQDSSASFRGSTKTDYKSLQNIVQECHSQKYPNKDRGTTDEINAYSKRLRDSKVHEQGAHGNSERAAESATITAVELVERRPKTGGESKSLPMSSVEGSFTTASLSRHSVCAPIETTVSKNLPTDSTSLQSSEYNTSYTKETRQRNHEGSERRRSRTGSHILESRKNEATSEVTGKSNKRGLSVRQSTSVTSFNFQEYPTEIAQSSKSDHDLIVEDVILGVELTARHAAGTAAARDQAFEAAGFAVKAVAYEDILAARRAVQVAHTAAQAAAKEAFCAARESAKASSLATISKCSRRAAALATASALAAQQDSVSAGRFFNNAADALRCLEVTESSTWEERLAAAAFKQVISSSVYTTDAAAKAKMHMTEAACAAQAAESAIADAPSTTDGDVSRHERAAVAAAKGAAEAAAQAHQKAQSAARASIEASKIASYSCRSTFVASAVRHSCSGADDAKSQAAAASEAASAASTYAQQAQNAAAVIVSSTVSETAKTAACSAALVAAAKTAAARSASECSEARSVASEAAARIASCIPSDRQRVSPEDVRKLEELALAKTAEAEAAACTAVEKAESAASHAAKAKAVSMEVLQLAHLDEAAAFAGRYASAAAEDAKAANNKVVACRSAAANICLHLPQAQSSESIVQIKSPSPFSAVTERRSTVRHSDTSRTRRVPRLPPVPDT